MATLAQLRERVRQRADMVNSLFVSDSELNQYISDSYTELYDLLVLKFEDYYLEEYTASVASGASSIDLPTNFYKLRAVDFAEGDNSWTTLRPFNFMDRNNENVARGYYGSNYPRYRVMGNKLLLSPTECAPGNYKLWIVPRATALTTDASTVDGVNGWDDYIVVDAAIKCLQKEESDVSVLMVLKGDLKNRIQAAAAERDVGYPDRITDVYNQFGLTSRWR